MNGHNFTERVRKVLMMAQEESVRLQHEYLGTEHILLGLIREGEGVAPAVLQNLGVDLDGVVARIEDIVKTGRATRTVPDRPFTSRARKVLELSMESALILGHSYVGTEHLLLGLLREQKGIAAQVLMEARVTLDLAQAEALRLLGNTDPNAVRLPSAARAAATGGTASVTSVTVEVRRDDGSVKREDFPGVLSAIGFLSRQ